MDMLGGLLGGQRPQYDDFIQRYDKGAPWDGIGDDEALDRYREVAPQLPDDVYEQSAAQAFSRLSPEQRAEFGRWLQTQGRQHDARIPDLDGDGRDDRFQDPQTLARAATQMRRQQPGLLDGLLGSALGGGTGALGGMGGGLGSALGGLTGGQAGGGMLSSPIAKAALAGIAAIAAQKVLGGR
jgi:hypothetical protein